MAQLNFPLPGFAATRAEALAQLNSFVPAAGRYSRRRNHVLRDHSNVSRLSPAIRHRLLTEAEAAAAPLRRYAPSTVEKFTQEIYWRRYWKGWLSLRPQVWDEYRADLDRIQSDAELACIRDRAGECESGRSGIAVMNHFARELVETGYLHNHARMWFAGWWIHVERLPWQLGADFFFRHLLDGDPASNTLSWRWVAGLQTPGKTYLPRRSNIEKHLDPDILGECREGLEQLEHPRACIPDRPARPPVTQPELPGFPVRAGLPTGLWIHEEDLCPETAGIDAGGHQAIIATGHRAGWTRFGFPARKISWLERAIGDAAQRAEETFGSPPDLSFPEDLASALSDWAGRRGLRQIVSLRPETGPLHDEVGAIREELGKDGIHLAMVDREEDQLTRGLATGGFFGFWKNLQRILPLPAQAH